MLPIPTVLANFCLEIISKVFADRLSTIVPKLISNEQRGLIPHCIYLAFEAIVSTIKKAINKSGNKCCGGNVALKFDIKKTFDTL
jgi:hypothetical protein